MSEPDRTPAHAPLPLADQVALVLRGGGALGPRTRTEHWQAGRAAVAETIDRASFVATNILDGKTAAVDLTRR